MNFDDLMKLPADKAKAIFDHTTPPLPTETANTHQQAGEGWDTRRDIVEMTSKMLDNPDESGIYPTTKFYDRMEKYIDMRIAAAREEECNSWINQPANEHDNRIRAAMKAEILVLMERRASLMSYGAFKGLLEEIRSYPNNQQPK